MISDDTEVNRRLKETDKARKIQIGLAHAEKYDPNHFMVVDADDCISNKIAGYVNNMDTEHPGWYVKRGYYYKEGQSLVFLNLRSFNFLCGTCQIIRFDLRREVFLNEPFLYYDHQSTEISEEHSLTPLPFSGAVYSLGNGENHHMTGEMIKEQLNITKVSYMSRLKGIYSKFRKYRPRPIDPIFKQKYGFYKLSPVSMRQ